MFILTDPIISFLCCYIKEIILNIVRDNLCSIRYNNKIKINKYTTLNMIRLTVVYTWLLYPNFCEKNNIEKHNIIKSIMKTF